MVSEISNAFVSAVLADAKILDGRRQLSNKLDFSGESLVKWKKMASYAIEFLDRNGIEYCLIKAYDIPFAFMEDVDILVENRAQLLQVYSLLMSEGFRFKHVPFNDELKLSSLKQESNIEIDFYPDSKWGQLRYSKRGSILPCRRLGSKHGIKAWIPSAEDEVSMIASHAYNHGRITLLEVIAAARLIMEESPDLNTVLSTARRFHLEGATSVLLLAADQLMKSYGQQGIGDRASELRDLARRNFRELASRRYDAASLPVQFSLSSLISASFEKLVARGLDSSVSRFDELANFLLHNRFSDAFYTKIMPEYLDPSYMQRHLGDAAAQQRLHRT